MLTLITVVCSLTLKCSIELPKTSLVTRRLENDTQDSGTKRQRPHNAVEGSSPVVTSLTLHGLT